MLKENVKWTLFQLATLIAMIILLICIDHFMVGSGTPTSNNRTLYLTGGIFFVLISWIYVMFYLQIKKHPNLMAHKIWKVMPLILSIIGVLSFIVFIILAVGPLFDLLDQWQGLFYIIMMYAVCLFFLFIMSLVHKFSASKHNILHQTYAWALGVLFVGAFLI